MQNNETINDKENFMEFLLERWYNELRAYNEEIEDINSYQITPESILRIVDIRDTVDDNVFSKNVAIHGHINLKYEENNVIGIDILPPTEDELLFYCSYGR